MRSAIIVSIAFFIALRSYSQSPDCFEVKYLDFFGLTDNEPVKWTDDELYKLLDLDYSQDERDNKYKTNFYIPAIVFQLKSFDPACQTETDPDRYQKLLFLYLKIRQQDLHSLDGQSVLQQLEFIRKDFYEQVENDELLRQMTFNLDDGPFFGQEVEINSESTNSVEINFGKITIVPFESGDCLIATDKEGEAIWKRKMTKGTESLTGLAFAGEPVRETSRATMIYMYADGELLTLTVHPDGRFMYYYHSW